ncbi:MAG TPA: hypothetical protein P5081_14045 [Phycisphaerae bacterium]|nr:hypothetical protein [Phycisphaerae bacterium]HRW53993.1 hypothetical protein [Phycisphaerae bacterium]
MRNAANEVDLLYDPWKRLSDYLSNSGFDLVGNGMKGFFFKDIASLVLQAARSMDILRRRLPRSDTHEIDQRFGFLRMQVEPMYKHNNRNTPPFFLHRPIVPGASAGFRNTPPDTVYVETDLTIEPLRKWLPKLRHLLERQAEIAETGDHSRNRIKPGERDSRAYENFITASQAQQHYGVLPHELSRAANSCPPKIRTRKAPRGFHDDQGKKVRKLYHRDDVRKFAK